MTFSNRTQPPASLGKSLEASHKKAVQTELAENAILIYLSNVKEGREAASMTGDAIQFRQENGTYASGENAVTPESIKQVKVIRYINGKLDEQYFARVNSVDGTQVTSDNPNAFKATAWVKTDKDGHVKDNTDLTLCYGGFTGDVKKLKAMATPLEMLGISTNINAPANATPDEKAMYEVHNHHFNNQLDKVQGFAMASLAKAETATGHQIDVVNSIGHSNGGTQAALSKAYMQREGKRAHALLMDPYRAREQAEKAEIKYHLRTGELTDDKQNTTTVVPKLNGIRDARAASFMGAGIGDQQFVDIRVDSVTIDKMLQAHKSLNMSNAAAGGRVAEDTPQMASGGNSGGLMGGLASLLGGGRSTEATPSPDATTQPRAGKPGVDLGSMDLGTILFAMILTLAAGGGEMKDMFASLLQGMKLPEGLASAQQPQEQQQQQQQARATRVAMTPVANKPGGQTFRG